MLLNAKKKEIFGYFAISSYPVLQHVLRFFFKYLKILDFIAVFLLNFEHKNPKKQFSRTHYLCLYVRIDRYF